MLIRNATKEQINLALEKTSEQFEHNIVFRRRDRAGHTRNGDEKWTVTLTVRDSANAGSRRSQRGRRVAAACWHAYGTFMDLLPEDAEIVVATPKGRQTKRPGDEWEDYNIGSPYRPFYHSGACEC